MVSPVGGIEELCQAIVADGCVGGNMDISGSQAITFDDPKTSSPSLSVSSDRNPAISARGGSHV